MSRAVAFFTALSAVVCLGCDGSGSRAVTDSASRLRPDWLIAPGVYKAEVLRRDEGRTLILTNGLVRRTFRLQPDAATVDFENLSTGESLLRAVRPEAQIVADGRVFPVGGLRGQVEQAYLVSDWLAAMAADPSAFHYISYRVEPVQERFPWKRKRWNENRPWPPNGICLTLNFEPPPGFLPGVSVSILYELYDGLPLLAKQLLVRNGGPRAVRINTFSSEILAVVESESAVNSPATWDAPGLHVESDYAYLADSPRTASRTTFWGPDPSYTSQVNWRLETPCVLESRPPVGPDQDIAAGGQWASFTTFELVFDSRDRERRGLALRRMYRTIAPWTTENPIFMHLKSTDPSVVRAAVDQCAEAGFEMLILSFGSGLDMENDDPAYLAGMKAAADYAHSRGIEIGGYSLLASRRIDDASDVIDAKTGRPGGAAFGSSPCLGSAWGRQYFRKLKNFFEKTGFDMLEHDGSYAGDLCASTSHPGHRGLLDSQWTQWQEITAFYKWCRARGLFLNVPDWYFLSGSNKTAMGYREVNWSLPRERQVILARQNIFDGTWAKTPSMGWMFLPLVEYQGGGAEATIEPLADHLPVYEAHLGQNFLAGVQACYRGTRLYDTDETKAAVQKWVALYKKYRKILDSDIIHLRRPDGRHLDGLLHVNPALPIKGLAVLFNPTNYEMSETVSLPLYYTGLRNTARIRERDGRPENYGLDGFSVARVPVRLGPRQMTWFIVE